MKVAILGATGCVGSAAAFHIAMSGLVNEILLVGGTRQNVLEHHAIDLETAAAEHNITVTAGQYSDLPESDIIINAAGAHQPLSQKREDIVTTQALFIRNIAQQIKTYCPNAVIITAVNPIESMIYATYLAGAFQRSQLIGFSINDTTRFRIALAKEFSVPLTKVEGAVIGEHGATQVPLFSSVRIDGQSVVISDEMKERIRAKTPEAIKRFESLKAGRTAGWTCAVGLLKMTRAIIEDNGTVIPCSVVLDGEYGQTDLSMAVPIVLGKTGVTEILEYPLDEDEKNAMEVTVQTIQTDIQTVTKLF